MATGNAITVDGMDEGHEKTYTIIKEVINPINYI